MQDDFGVSEWIEKAKCVGILEVASRLGAALKRAGSEHVGPCPSCGHTDTFNVHPRKGIFICHQSDATGDGIAMVQHCRGVEFLEAVEWITGEAKPGGGREISDEQRTERYEDRRDEQMERRIAQDKADAANEVRKATKRSHIDAEWHEAGALRGSHGEAYYAARGLVIEPGWCRDIRFVPASPLWGNNHDDERDAPPRILGHFPCIIAPMRDTQGTITALHRTWLHPEIPARPKSMKKKVDGEPMGSLIWITDPAETTATGEGVETTWAFGMLHRRGDLAGCALAAAYSIGNLCGKAMGTRPHPDADKSPKDRKSVPNGIPDMSSVAMVIPEEVTRVILLGDHEAKDGKQAWTYAHLLTGARRLREQGKEALIWMADLGGDFNDAAIRRRKAA